MLSCVLSAYELYAADEHPDGDGKTKDVASSAAEFETGNGGPETGDGQHEGGKGNSTKTRQRDGGDATTSPKRAKPSKQSKKGEFCDLHGQDTLTVLSAQSTRNVSRRHSPATLKSISLASGMWLGLCCPV